MVGRQGRALLKVCGIGIGVAGFQRSRHAAQSLHTFAANTTIFFGNVMAFA
jgi:hypothetical protein